MSDSVWQILLDRSLECQMMTPFNLKKAWDKKENIHWFYQNNKQILYKICISSVIGCMEIEILVLDMICGMETGWTVLLLTNHEPYHSRALYKSWFQMITPHPIWGRWICFPALFHISKQIRHKNRKQYKYGFHMKGTPISSTKSICWFSQFIQNQNI